MNEQLAERLLAEDVGLVLDVGCGTGRFATAAGGHLDWIVDPADARQGALTRLGNGPLDESDALLTVRTRRSSDTGNQARPPPLVARVRAWG